MFRLRSVIVLAALIGCVLSDGAPYSFNYEANDEGQHQRNEQGQHGQVQGSYSYVDPNGHLRQVNYVADEYGFRPSGDIGVDRETEAAAADLANQAPPSSINFNPPGASQGGSYGSGGSYGGQQSSQRSNYGGQQSQKGYSAPARPRPSPPRAPRPSYQSPSKQGYQQRPAAKQWKPSKPSYQQPPQQQQQQDDYSGSSGDTYSFNTQITHAQPSQRPYGKPSSPASYGKQRPQKPAYKQSPPPPPQQQQQQDWQDDGSYDQSNDWSEQSSGPKQSVAYEVRAPSHKIIAKYN